MQFPQSEHTLDTLSKGTVVQDFIRSEERAFGANSIEIQNFPTTAELVEPGVRKQPRGLECLQHRGIR